MKHASAFLQLVEEAMPRITEISAEQVKSLMDHKKACIVIDVREDSEWAAGHIPDAVHMGRGVLERDIERAIPDRETMLVLYCGGGYRSALAADSLQKMGYTQVSSMAGGWSAWNQNGFPRA